MRFNIPIFTLLLCFIVLTVSFLVAYEVNGSVLSKVRILDLKKYGGVTFQQLREFEVWRLVSSQLVHVKPIHMLFNVISLFFIGMLIERKIGGQKLLQLFFVSGIIGTLASIITVPSPYDVGTGASQAVLGLTGCGVLFMVKGLDKSIWLKLALIFCIAPALALDIIYSGYPKVGHIVGFTVGVILSLFFISNIKKTKYVQVNS
ncbi:rhomboid family intramembrane serine protease [Cognaticolwellia mytili]|uniref:rhomboid family intramembrane serine protease n=1 Tax=Cognaticolwellia mytili TaxID=1888913 RepID=UPI001B80BC03|nr:rhomboid family intramembrane serine protease [Cognaticolwellia mytili]